MSFNNAQSLYMCVYGLNTYFERMFAVAAELDLHWGIISYDQKH